MTLSNPMTLASDLKATLGLGTPNSMSKDLGKTQRVQDEAAVTLCYNTIKNWNNPFQKSNVILSLSSGVAVSKEIEDDLIKTLAVRSITT